ncbi:MAG TPA: hypothetical protein VFY14_07440 [Streptomyces sp.]|nr:hypothetical protein [Streptomyces sp.]
MALIPVPIAVTGAPHTAQQFRMMVKDLARNQQGVTTGADLKVSALPVNGAGVQVGDGSAVIAGRKSPVQGSYSVYNVGASTVPVAATGGTGRSDLLVLRVEDPEYEGNRDPETDPVTFFEIIPNVASNATTVPAGYSAIPLARIDIPASTATITNAMIKDLRRVANPRRDRVLTPYHYPGPLTEISGTSETWKTFPALASASPPGAMAAIAVPAWAASAKVVFGVTGLRLVDGNVWGNIRFQLGTVEAGQYIAIDDNQGTGPRRMYVEMSDTIDLTTTAGAALRGTTQPFYSRMRTRASNVGRIGVDGTTSFKIDIEFLEGPL